MKEIDATRMKLKALEMVEGTDLRWFSVIRMARVKGAKPYAFEVKFTDSANDYEFAIGIVGGKQVWKGDTLFHNRWGTVVARASGTKGFLKIEDTDMSHRGAEYLASSFSWIPPHKTVMVEHTIEDMKAYIGRIDYLMQLAIPAEGDVSVRIAETFRKALEQTK